MKTLIEKLVKLRNPNFKLDEDLNSQAIVQFIWVQVICVLRGFKFLYMLKSPNMAILGRSTKFFNSSKFKFGKFLKLGDFVYISALGKKGVSFGNNVSIGAHSRVVVSTTLNEIGEHIIIGNNVGIGEFAYLGGAGGLEIGDDCIVGQYLSCHPENHNYQDTSQLIRNQGVNRSGIKIGKNCWIGSKVTILDGVTIGNGCIIAAGAVVNASFPDNCIIGGVPAKLLKTIE